MSMYKDIKNQNNPTPYNASSNKSNMTEEENIIFSQPLPNSNIKTKNEYTSLEMDDNNNAFNNNYNKSQIYQQNKTPRNNSYSKNYISSHLKINCSDSNFKKGNNIEHIVINSKTKKMPNLMKNIHYRTDTKRSYDSFRYQPISSFEAKLSKQLSRISNKYTVIKNRKFFNNQLTSTNLYWVNFPDYEIYRQLKELETRKEFPNAFTRPRLKPLISQNKDKLGKLAKNLYEADQVERFKKYLNKNYNIKVGE